MEMNKDDVRDGIRDAMYAWLMWHNVEDMGILLKDAMRLAMEDFLEEHYDEILVKVDNDKK